MFSPQWHAAMQNILRHCICIHSGTMEVNGFIWGVHSIKENKTSAISSIHFPTALNNPGLHVNRFLYIKCSSTYIILLSAFCRLFRVVGAVSGQTYSCWFFKCNLSMLCAAQNKLCSLLFTHNGEQAENFST